MAFTGRASLGAQLSNLAVSSVPQAQEVRAPMFVRATKRRRSRRKACTCCSDTTGTAGLGWGCNSLVTPSAIAKAHRLSPRLQHSPRIPLGLGTLLAQPGAGASRCPFMLPMHLAPMHAAQGGVLRLGGGEQAADVRHWAAPGHGQFESPSSNNCTLLPLLLRVPCLAGGISFLGGCERFE